MKTIKITFLAITLLALGGLTNFLNAQCAIDQSQLLWNGGTSERNLPGYYESQSFTAGSTGSLCEIDMLMFNTMTGTGTLNIYKGNGITGALLATQTVTIDVPTMTSVWQDWTISNPPAVVADTAYTFQFIPTQGGGLPDPYGVDIQTSDVYAGGYCITNSPWDLPFRTYVDLTTGVRNVNNESNFAVFPNPSSGKFTINCNINTNKIDIFNCLGEKVFSSTANLQKSIDINLSAATKGIYFVKISGKDNTYVKKIVLQ